VNSDNIEFVWRLQSTKLVCSLYRNYISWIQFRSEESNDW